MPSPELKLPRGRSYYYEITDVCTRLWCCLTPADLQALIDARRCKAQILKDYPDGIDLKVSEEAFAEFERRYGLKLEHSAPALKSAFEWTVRQSPPAGPRGGPGKPAPQVRTGFLKADFVEIVALDAVQDGSRPVPLKARSAKTRALHRVAVARQTENIVHRLNVRHASRVNRQAPLSEQEFARVDLEDGRDTLDVFRTLHAGKGR